MTPPMLMEELVEEILLRFPADDPAPLFRAALVCKAWCRLISGAIFRRRFLNLHPTPPLLGFMCRSGCSSRCGYFWLQKTYFKPTSTFRLPSSSANISGWHAMDSLHSSILFWDKNSLQFVVWSPITSEVRRLPTLCQRMSPWGTVLVCATAGCCHIDCGASAFAVVFVGTDSTKGLTSVYVYTSEQQVWNEPISTIHDRSLNVIEGGPAIGTTVYFECAHERTSKILAYEMCKQELSFLSLPSVRLSDYSFSALMTTDEGKLGLAMARDVKLFTWSREAGPDRHAADWIQQRVFELEKMLPPWVFSWQLQWFAAPDSHGVSVIKAPGDVLFTVDLKSGAVTQLPKGSADKDTYFFLPYKCFFIPSFVLSH